MKIAREQARDERGKQAGSKSTQSGEGSSGFGRRRERPDAELMRVLNTGASGASQRTPRSISPPLD